MWERFAHLSLSKVQPRNQMPRLACDELSRAEAASTKICPLVTWALYITRLAFLKLIHEGGPQIFIFQSLEDKNIPLNLFAAGIL